MQAWTLVDKETLVRQERPLVPLQDGWVRIRPAYCGICGSDLHSFKGKHPMVRPPIVLGHELSGVVAAVGQDVHPEWIGRRVVVEPSLPCGTCYACQHGQYHICFNLQVVGNVGADGALAEYLDVPATRVVPLPHDMALDLAALVEPTAVAVHAVRRVLPLTRGAVVLGAGPIGLLTALTVKAMGFEPVLITDVRSARLKMSRALGLSHTADPHSAPKMARTLFSDGPDAVFDCVAVSDTVNQALDLARKGTAVVLVGVPEEPLWIDAIKIQDRELSLVGTLMYQRQDFETAIDLIYRQQIPAQKLITRVVPFDQVPDAFRRLVDDPQDDVKVLIKVSDVDDESTSRAQSLA